MTNLKVITYNAYAIEAHKGACPICRLPVEDLYDVNILFINRETKKTIAEYCKGKYDIEFNRNIFNNHKNYLPFILPSSQFTMWYSKYKYEMSKYKVEDSKDYNLNKYEYLEKYLKQIEGIIQTNFDIVQAKEETLKYIYGILLPELLGQCRTSAHEIAEFKGFAGLASMVKVLFEKALILEADVGARLYAQGRKEEIKDAEKFDPEKILKLIRSSTKEV